MSIFDIFTAAKPATQAAPVQQQQQQQVAPGNIPATADAASKTAVTSGTAPNGTVPANTVVTEGATKSGLDQFADIWNTEATQGTQGQPLFNVSQEKMMEAARKQNFTAGIDPELMAKITAGGPEAAQAMIEMMNTVAQNAYAQSAFAGTRLIEGALEKSKFAKTADIDSRVKSLSLNNNLRAENPMFSHPAAKPMLEAVQQQLLVKFPNATPNELADMAKNYLTEFTNAFNAPQQQQQQQQQAQAAKGDDWSKFFE